jgi:hypothetical protein
MEEFVSREPDSSAKQTEKFRRSSPMKNSESSQPPSCRYEINPLECSHPEIFGSTSAEKCASCSKYRGRPRGLGDVVHSITTATGIAKAVDTVTGGCGGCAARRAALNAAVPFSDTPKEK